MKKLHSSERMSKIVIHNNTIYLSGQVGNAEDDIKAQTLTKKHVRFCGDE